jgi:hypothetical protein
MSAEALAIAAVADRRYIPKKKDALLAQDVLCLNAVLWFSA